MAEVVHEFRELFFDDECNLYVVRAYGEPTRDGRWQGWIGFHGNGMSWFTAPATLQASKEALASWAAALPQAWLDRALSLAKVTAERNQEMLVLPPITRHDVPAPFC